MVSAPGSTCWRVLLNGSNDKNWETLESLQNAGSLDPLGDDIPNHSPAQSRL